MIAITFFFRDMLCSILISFSKQMADRFALGNLLQSSWQQFFHVSPEHPCCPVQQPDGTTDSFNGPWERLDHFHTSPR